MMPPVIAALLAFMIALFRLRASLHLEHLALWHQLAVYQRSMPRPRLCATDRLFWAWLSRLWSGWQNALALIQPRTVIAWQCQRFRDYWRQLSQQGTPGRPTIAKKSATSSAGCGRPIQPGVHHGSLASCASWALTWPHR